MPGWALDEARFREEVFQPIDADWDPRDNLFRCYQLPVDTEDTDRIDKALDGVSRYIKRNAIGGPFVGVANTLLEVHKDAVRILRDSGARAQHRKRVQATQQTLREALRAEIAGAREVPAAVVKAMADRRTRRFARREVDEALAGLGCRVREPVELPVGKLPSDWRKIKEGLRFLRFPTLGHYLRERFPAGAGVTRDDLSQRRAELDRQASGDALTAETKILVALQRWLSKGELREMLRAEAIQELATEAAMGADSLDTALQRPGIPRYLADLGLPKAGDLAYALLCQARYPAVTESTWQSTYQQARAARELRSAYDILAAQQSLPADLVTARDELKAQIGEVDRLLARARVLENQDVETAAELYVQVTRLCSDQEAESALRRCRPTEPPSALARVDGERVHVAWKPSAARVGDIAYRVVRQVRGSAESAESVLAANTSSLAVTDTAAPAGVPVLYAVWTLRNDEPSIRAATTAPVTVLRAVQHLELLPGDGVVELRWQLPTGATGARVLRGETGSTRRQSTQQTATRHDGDGFRDTTVRTGVTYSYQIEAEYRLPDGTVRYGTGVSGTVRPQEPPRPVHDLALQPSDDAVLLSWTPPPHGEVQLRLLDTAPEAHPGTLLTLAAAQRLGGQLRPVGPAGTPGTLRAAIPADGRRHWLLPLTVAEHVAAVGSPVEYDSRLPMITDLRAERLGSQVRLTWRWPPRAVEVRVSSKPEGPPTGPDDPDATSWRVTQAKYEQGGCYTALPGGDHWFSVCVAAFTDGAVVFGPMATTRISAPLEARYEITRMGRLRHRHHRRLSVTSSGQLPAVCVVARVRLPPLEPGDGMEVARFPAPGTGETSLTGEFVLPTTDRPLYLRVFPLNVDTTQIVLVPANPGQLRID